MSSDAREDSMGTGNSQARQVPPEVSDTLNHWRCLAAGIRVLHVILVILAVGCSLVASTVRAPASIVWLSPKLFSFAAALAISLLSAFELGKKANAIRDAWRVLTAAVWRYKYETDFTLEKLIAAYESAERNIGGVKESPSPN